MAQLPLEVVGVISVWIETCPGVYTCLFFTTVYITLKKRNHATHGPLQAFFLTTLLMFGVCTTHVAINLYRLLRGYVWLRETVGPANYFLDLGRWDNIAHDALNAVMTWMGDALVIYRCFIVWDNNYFIIAVPSALLVVSIIANSIALQLFTEVPLGTIFSPTLVHWMNTIYGTAFVQNFMTTSLIAYRIWRQDRASAIAGVHSQGSGTSSLIPIVRIIVESAALYMMQLIILIILYARNHNAQFIIQESLVPTIGIVFTLISVRISLRSSRLLKATTVRPTGLSAPLEWHMPTTVTDTETGLGPSLVSSRALELASEKDSAPSSTEATPKLQ
ncbi:hypothetical protein BDZ89DRAFT_949212 [Hymenopellis radicata]|nr:hypothetical protein BDZ89DRAFT_949212 [Hymenopellis radicata]